MKKSMEMKWEIPKEGWRAMLVIISIMAEKKIHLDKADKNTT